jgi:hypothetical protein
MASWKSALPAIVFAAAISLPAAADPALLNLAPPDAKIVAGADVTLTLNSPLGQFLLSRTEANDKNFQQFITDTGFDPRRDLREVIVASKTAAKGHDGLVIARGIFNSAQILGFAGAHGATVTTYQGVNILSGPNGRTEHGLAFLNGSIAVLGPADEVRNAIDRWRTGARFDPALAAKITDVSSRNDAWVVTFGSPALLAGTIRNPTMSGAMKGDVLQGIEQASGGVKFGSSVVVSAEAVTRSEKDATALSDVIRFLVSLAQLNSDQQAAAAIGEIISTMQLTTEANTVKFSVSVPEAQLEKLFRSGGKARVRPAAKGR